MNSNELNNLNKNHKLLNYKHLCKLLLIQKYLCVYGYALLCALIIKKKFPSNHVTTKNVSLKGTTGSQRKTLTHFKSNSEVNSTLLKKVNCISSSYYIKLRYKLINLSSL